MRYIKSDRSLQQFRRIRHPNSAFLELCFSSLSVDFGSMRLSCHAFQSLLCLNKTLVFLSVCGSGIKGEPEDAPAFLSQHLVFTEMSFQYPSCSRHMTPSGLVFVLKRDLFGCDDVVNVSL